MGVLPDWYFVGGFVIMLQVEKKLPRSIIHVVSKQ